LSVCAACYWLFAAKAHFARSTCMFRLELASSSASRCPANGTAEAAVAGGRSPRRNVHQPAALAMDDRNVLHASTGGGVSSCTRRSPRRFADARHRVWYAVPACWRVRSCRHENSPDVSGRRSRPGSDAPDPGSAGCDTECQEHAIALLESSSVSFSRDGLASVDGRDAERTLVSLRGELDACRIDLVDCGTALAARCGSL
jgi:hypothetical protein